MRANYMKRVCAVLLAALIAIVFAAVSTYEVNAESDVIKMKAFDEVIKVGNTAYCSTYGGIYKVNIKTGKSVRLVKAEQNEWLHYMKKKGNYIYYMVNGAINNDIYRVKISGGKAKMLFNGYNTKAVDSYAISGKKLYITYGDSKNKVMKLDGKSKKKTSISAKTIGKKTNKKNWRVVEKEKGKYIYSYLKSSKTKILICKTENVFY